MIPQNEIDQLFAIAAAHPLDIASTPPARAMIERHRRRWSVCVSINR